MSDDGQQYPIDDQKAAIAEYAKPHGFVIVRTYADAGKKEWHCCESPRSTARIA
jgi:DNA invertase Pin-like site-specific DNA recombinase